MTADFTRLRNLLDSLIPFGVTGVDCAISIRGERVFRHGAGFADLENGVPVAGNELYNIYSLTKLVTCAAALRLFEEGRFLLSDPLSEYLPEFKDMTVMREDGELRAAARPIRVGNLFTMTAGLSYDISSPPLAALRESSPDCTTREFVRAIARSPLLFEAGEQWNYSLCHDVLGALVEVVAGRSLGEYFRAEIFSPLHMNDTFFRIPDAKKSRLAAQYARGGDAGSVERIPSDNVFSFGSRMECGGAGLVSSVEDYLTFADALANGGTAKNGYRLLSAATVSLMGSDHLNDAQRAGLKKMVGRGFGYGLGAAVVTDRAAAGTAAPNGQFGWGGAAGAQAFIDPENALALVYMQHILGGDDRYVTPRLRNVLYACL